MYCLLRISLLLGMWVYVSVSQIPIPVECRMVYNTLKMDKCTGLPRDDCPSPINGGLDGWTYDYDNCKPEVILTGFNYCNLTLTVDASCFDGITTYNQCTIQLPCIAEMELDIRVLPPSTHTIVAPISNPTEPLRTVKWEQLEGPSVEIADNTTTYIIDGNLIPEGYYKYKVCVYKNDYSSIYPNYMAFADVSFYFGGAQTTYSEDGHVITVTLDAPVEHTGSGICASMVVQPEYLGTGAYCEMVDQTHIKFYYGSDGAVGQQLTFSANFNTTIFGSFSHVGLLPTAALSISSTSITDADTITLSITTKDLGSQPATYLWTTPSGPETLTFSPAGQSSYTLSGSDMTRGTYTISGALVSSKSYTITINETASFTLKYSFTVTQIGHKFTFTSTGNFNLGESFTCVDLMSGTYLGNMGSTPLCEHTNNTNILTIYPSQDHTLVTGTEISLGVDNLITSAYYVEGDFPTLELSITPNMSGYVNSTMSTTLGFTFVGYNIINIDSIYINSVIWTLNSGPALPSFNTTDIHQIWGANTLTLGEYNFSAVVTLTNSWSFSQNLIFRVFATLVNTTYVGQRLQFEFDGEIAPFTSCAEVLTGDTIAFMGTSPICTSPLPKYLEIWFDQDADHSVTSKNIEFFPLACLFEGPYTLPHNLPYLAIDNGGSYSTWEDRNLTGKPTDITGVTPTPTYTFTQIEGPETLNLNSTETYQYFPKGSLLTGTYNFQLRMDFPPEFKSLYREATASLVLTVSLGEVIQLGNELNIILSWAINIEGNRINEPINCNKVLDTASNALLSPSLCRHKGNILYIFVSNVSSVVATDTITLLGHPAYTSTISFPMPLDPPRLTLHGSGTFDTEGDIIITGVPTSVHGVSPIYTWTQLSGPQQFIFISHSLVQTFKHPIFIVGTYQFALNMQIPNSNDYLNDAHATVNILSKFKSGTQLGNQFEIVLTWPLEINGNITNKPIDCDIILEANHKTVISPIQCNHNYNTIGIITRNTSALAQSSIIHLRPLPAFSESVNFTIPNDLPKISISGGGTYSTFAPITLTALPTDITGYLPTYEWKQISGPETLILNNSFISQTFSPDVLSTGQYEFEVVMSFPETTLGYTYKASSTIIIQAAFVKGEQYGGRFKIYLTYSIWLLGSKNNPSLDCTEILDSNTLDLLKPSLCTHNEELLTIFASNLSTGNVVNLFTQSFFSESIAYTGPKDMPILLPIVQSGTDPWESSGTGNSFTTSNSNCEGLQVEYIWEVISGNPLTQLTGHTESSITFEPMSITAGDYTIKCAMAVAGGNGYISTQTIDFSIYVRVFVQSQKGSVITIIMSGSFYLNSEIEGNSTCSNILPSTFISKMGSNPKCSHEGSLLRVYLSNNSIVTEGDSFELQHTHFTTKSITNLKASPTLTLSIPTSMDGKYQVRALVTQIKAELINSEDTNYTFTWSQVGGSAPSTILFDNTKLSQIIGEKLIKDGNYSVGVKILFDNSNNFELNKIVDFTYASIPTAKIVGGMISMNYNLELELRTYMSVDNDIGNFSSELKWTWEGSSDPDFTTPAVMYNGSDFTPEKYNNQDLKFGTKELKSGTYFFKLKMSKWEKFVGETSTYIKVHEFGPTIKLTSSSTTAKHNPLIDLCIQASISSYDGLEIKTKWFVQPFPAELDTTSERLCILAKFLVPGTTYSVTCAATEIPNIRRMLGIPEEYTRSMTTEIIVSKYPCAKEFEITPMAGHGLTDLFTFNLWNWYDTEGTQLKYMILAKVVGSTIGFVAVNSYTSLETFTTFLPTGDSLYNYLVIVRIQGVNGFGATVHKDATVKVIEPENVEDPEKFLDEELFLNFEERPISDKLYRMSSAVYLAELPQAIINVSEPCGGCGENGKCLIQIKECSCQEGYDGQHCYFSPQGIKKSIAVITNILTSNIYTYIYIYNIEANEILDAGNLNLLFEGEDGNTLISAIQGATKEQNFDKSEPNKLAKKALDTIRNFLKSSLENDTKAKIEAEKTGDLYMGHSYMNENSQSKLFHSTSNLMDGMTYQKKQKGVKRERRRLESAGRELVEVRGEEISSETESNASTSSTYSMNIELKSLVEDIGSIALESSQIGEKRDITTNNFGYQGAKVKSQDLIAKSLTSTNSRVTTPSADLGLPSLTTKLQFLEWDKNPLDGHPQADHSITRTIGLSFYALGSVHSLNISNTKLPFYFFMKVITPSHNHYCAYFNHQTQKYSDRGMKLVYKRVVPNGTGLLLCSANHLSEFTALKDAPAEHIDILTKSNYDVLNKTNYFSDYNYLNSPSNISTIIYNTNHINYS